MATRRTVRVNFVMWLSLGIIFCVAPEAGAAAVFLGPSPYLSFNDSPFVTTNLFDFFCLEDFEDGVFNVPGASPSGSWIVLSPGPLTDSVDGDDGAVDGSGTGGHSFFSNLSATNLTITFDAVALGGHLPTHAGIVCTDIGTVTEGTFGEGNVSFTACDANGATLGFITATNFGNGSAAGDSPKATAEDRFFGVVNPGGISSITISVNNSVDWEVDHLQYGYLRPVLRIQPTSTNTILIAWPLAARAFTLQQNYDASSTNWTAVTNAPVKSGGEFRVNVAPTSERRLYRLSAQ